MALAKFALFCSKITALKSKETSMEQAAPKKVVVEDHLKSPENCFNGPPTVPPVGSPRE